MASKGKDDIASTISKLSIGSSKAASSKKPKEPVADSWEDEDVSDDEAEAAAEAKEEDDEEDQGKDVDAGISTPSSLATPAVPPPTPASPLGYESPHEWASLASQSQSQSPMATTASASGTGSGSGTPARRPEKTDAVARRLIAAGLGIKAPRQTDEQRAYQRSVREQEKKKREEAKAEEERRRAETEKAKMAVWDD
ncbi:hypothetical protein ACHAPX_001739 [Trichoderma viride]|jgi:hypothetical protein